MPATVFAFRSGETALLRAVACPELNLPQWPDLTHDASDVSMAPQLTWLRQVWQRADVVEELSLDPWSRLVRRFEFR